MVKYQDKEVVQALAYQFEHADEIKKDYRRDFANGDRLIVDAGNKGESAILDTAVELIENATSSVRAISFFTPDGRFVKELSDAAKKGIDVKVIRPEGQWGFSVFGALDFINRAQMKLRRQEVPFENTPQRLHVKLLIVDGKDAMFGSHNFMGSGVRAGTEEIAMRTQNPEVVDRLIQLYLKIITGALTQAA